jgi:hypothetical protein
VHVRAHRLQAAVVLPRGDPDEHLLHDPTIQRIGVGERVKRRQRDFFAVGSDPRSRISTFRPPSTTSLGTVPARDVERSG